MKIITPRYVISFLLSLCILFSSCVSYKQSPISEKQASLSTLPLKVTINSESYKVKSLVRTDSTLYVIAKRNSKLAKNYPNLIINSEEKMVRMDLSAETISAIHEKDQQSSTGQTVLLSIVVLVLVAIPVLFLTGSVDICC